MGGTTRLSVVVVSEVRLYREGLVAALGERPEFDALFAAGGPRAAIAEVGRAAVDVAAVDMSAAESRGAARALRGAWPEAKLVAFAVREAEPDVIACAEEGIDGYVTRDETAADLITAILMAARGETHCTGRIARYLSQRVSSMERPAPRRPAERRLTPREAEVLRLLEQGRSNKEIARYLSVKPATVKNHVHNLLSKLGVRTRSEAAALFRRSAEWSAAGATALVV